MNRQAVKVFVAVALGGFVLAAAGCGGGSSTTTTTETTTTSVSTTTSATTTGAAGTTTTAAGAVGAVGGLLSSKNCRNLVNLSASFSQAITGAVSGADLQKAETLMKQFADKTPADIRPDFEVLASAYAKYAEALKGVDLTSGTAPSADVIARLQKLSTEIDQAKLATASQHIGAWVQKNCTNGG
jgi:hypothetical protein